MVQTRSDQHFKLQEPGQNSKLSLGISLLLLGAILVFGSKPQKEVVVNSFANEPVDASLVSNNQTESISYPTRVVVPNVGIDLPVKPAKIIEGYWEVFDDVAGWGEGSGMPGHIGNQVIFAHARENLFSNLSDIKENDSVYILTDERWYYYNVETVKTVYPGNIEVIASTDVEVLTLYTCSGFKDEKRLIVTAKRLN